MYSTCSFKNEPLPQATGYQSENFKLPWERGIKPSSAAGGLDSKTKSPDKVYALG
jgi:hypothetical protein